MFAHVANTMLRESNILRIISFYITPASVKKIKIISRKVKAIVNRYT